MTAGHLLKDQVYLIIKNPHGPGTDVGRVAPAGTAIEWHGKTNAGSEDCYGGKSLHWIDLPEFGYNIGAELGVDFCLHNPWGRRP